MKLLLLVNVLVATTVVHAQSLLNATARYPQLSNFNELLSTFPDLAAGLLTNISTGQSRQTILVPSNDAFDNYQQQNGASIGSLSSSDVGNILNYHTLQGALSSSDIQQPNGLVSETALRNSTYATRENATDAGDSLPQVVYISSTETATGRKIKARQISALSSVDVRSGRGNEIELEQTPGNWSGGNAARGLTCVCPNDEALEALSNNNGNLTDGPGSLLATLTRHGLTGSYYSTNFTDGDIIHSQNGYPILVTRRNGSIFLNDAQVVGSNYIANSGSVHALDRIMGFLNTTTNQTTPASASIYSDVANIPTPPPTPLSAETSSGGAIPTVNSMGNQTVPSATETGASASDPAASGDGAAETPPSEETSAAGLSMEFLRGPAIVSAAFVVGLFAL
ncbi:MAG: hypothetical protein Q9221_005266 [Calogaya cf. arnoldii]